MMDFPFEMLSQAGRGRSVSGEELEAFGKKAAELYETSEKTLSDAVVETVKHAGLNPEQVRRVVEFANTSAYLGEFKKEGSPHKVIDFHGGPADPSAVLQDLNDGGGGSVHDRGLRDYQGPPERTKHADVQQDQRLEALFATQAPNIPHENPMGEAIDLRDKLAALHDNLTSEIGGLEVMHMDLCQRLFENVKQASLEGYSLGEVIQVWAKVTNEPVFFKTAFAMLSPRLIENEVFEDLQAVNASLEKTGAERQVNMGHPLVHDFQEYCETIEALAGLREQQKQASAGLEEMTEFVLHPERFAEGKAASSSSGPLEELKVAASGGIIGAAAKAAPVVAKAGGKAGRELGRLISGPGGAQMGEALGQHAGTVTKYAPHAVGGLLALRAMQHLNAMGQTQMGHTVKSFIPGTQDYQNEQYRLQAQYGGMPYSY